MRWYSKSFCDLSHQAMEEEKPWVLVSEVGGEYGYLEELADILKQHFQIISYREFLLNPVLHGPKIQALLMWKYYPAAEPSLLRLLPSLPQSGCQWRSGHRPPGCTVHQQSWCEGGQHAWCSQQCYCRFCHGSASGVSSRDP